MLEVHADQRCTYLNCWRCFACIINIPSTFMSLGSLLPRLVGEEASLLASLTAATAAVFYGGKVTLLFLE